MVIFSFYYRSVLEIVISTNFLVLNHQDLLVKVDSYSINFSHLVCFDTIFLIVQIIYLLVDSPKRTNVCSFIPITLAFASVLGFKSYLILVSEVPVGFKMMIGSAAIDITLAFWEISSNANVNLPINAIVSTIFAIIFFETKRIVYSGLDTNSQDSPTPNITSFCWLSLKDLDLFLVIPFGFNRNWLYIDDCYFISAQHITSVPIVLEIKKSVILEGN